MFYLHSWLRQLAQRLSLPTGLRSRKKVNRLFRKRAGVRLNLEELESRITPTVNVWNGAGSWTTAANWSLGLPTTGQDVDIHSGVVNHSSGFDTLNTITVDSGATLAVTGGSSITVIAAAGPQITDNGSINLGDATTGGNLHIIAANAEVGTGLAGSIVLGANAGNTLTQGTGQTLKIDSGVVVSGKSGTVGLASNTLNNQGNIAATVSGGAVTVNLGNGTNSGTIAVSSNDTLTIASGSGNTWFSTGTIQATSGGILGLGSPSSTDHWHSQGTLTSTNSTVDLGGQFTQNDLGTFSFNSGSVVNIDGTLNGNVDLTGQTSSWFLFNGTLTNGTLSGGGSTIVASGLNNTLNNYALSSVIDLTNGGVNVTNGLTLNGVTLQVGDATNSSKVGRISFFSGAQIVSGTGSISFGIANGSDLLNVGSGATVTIGHGITIDGQNGQINGGGSLFPNDGVILAAASGDSMTISTLNFANNSDGIVQSGSAAA